MGEEGETRTYSSNRDVGPSFPILWPLRSPGSERHRSQGDGSERAVRPDCHLWVPYRPGHGVGTQDRDTIFLRLGVVSGLLILRESLNRRLSFSICGTEVSAQSPFQVEWHPLLCPAYVHACVHGHACVEKWGEKEKRHVLAGPVWHHPYQPLPGQNEGGKSCCCPPPSWFPTSV